MKKIALFLLFGILVTGTASFATYDGQGCWFKTTTVSEALKMNDDTKVIIKGNIVNKLSKDKYTFKDSTGSITVDIDNDKWGEIASDTKDTLELVGEIERKQDYVELDVDSVCRASK